MVIIQLVINAVILTSCSKFYSDSVDSRLVGSWQLIRSSDGIYGEVFAPDSAGLNETQLYFKSDRSYIISVDHSIIKKGSYSLAQKMENFL